VKTFLNAYGALCIGMYLLHAGLKWHERRGRHVAPNIHEAIHGLGHLARILLVLLALYLMYKSARHAALVA